MQQSGEHPFAPTVSASVRRAQATDVAELVALINRAHEARSADGGSRRTSLSEVQKLTEHGHFVVLDRSGGPLAAAMYVSAEHASGSLELLSVDPPLQGRGLGKRMVAVAEALCSAMGCTAVEVRFDNSLDHLPPWYRRLGYSQPSVVLDENQVDTQRGYVEMRKTLGN
jgi:GNAT superfamily N-acetyltransferase